MKRAAGFTLLEVLIAVTVLALGVLGLAAMQVRGLQGNHSAEQRFMATVLAQDLTERMRANAPGVREGRYDGGAPGAVDCVVTSCTPAEMAGFDLARWSADLAAQLPAGAGWVCRDTTPNDGTVADRACDGAGAVYAIKIWWDEARTGSAGQRFSMAFQP